MTKAPFRCTAAKRARKDKVIKMDYYTVLSKVDAAYMRLKRATLHVLSLNLTEQARRLQERDMATDEAYKKEDPDDKRAALRVAAARDIEAITQREQYFQDFGRRVRASRLETDVGGAAAEV